jgi:hypothetical protein
MPANAVVTNIPAASTLIAPSSATLSAASEILSILGFPDQHAAIIAAEQTEQEADRKLFNAIIGFEGNPDSRNRDGLIKQLNKKIERLKVEHKSIKAKQAEYQQAVSQSASSSYVSQWRDWLISGVKYIFGSDNASQIERYGDMAKAREEQLNKLESYRDILEAGREIISDEPQAIEEDVIELNTKDGIRMAAVQQSYAIGVQPNGDFVVTRRDGDDLYAQDFSADGSPLGTEFRVNMQAGIGVFLGAAALLTACGIYHRNRPIVQRGPADVITTVMTLRT